MGMATLGLSSIVFGLSPASQEKSDLFYGLVTQIIENAINSDMTRESIMTMFLGCSINHHDTVMRDACEDVLKKLAKKTDNTTQEQTPHSQYTTKSQYTLVEVVDGDTIKVEDQSGKVFSVRMIGIDAPESNTARYGYAECFGDEAKNHLKSLLDTTFVEIETDPSQGSFDKYNRLLGYVKVNGSNINERMIEDGYAFEYTYNLPYAYMDSFKKAQRNAALSGKGLYDSLTCNGERISAQEYAKRQTQKEQEEKEAKVKAEAALKSLDDYQKKERERRERESERRWNSSSHHYIRWPRGGCYYINSNGNKTYVSRSLCN